MRVLSYNILDGGEGRADPLAEVIEAQRADIVALVEADVPAVVERIANRLKMDYVIAKGGGDSVALLSRWRIVDSINHGALRKEIGKSFLEATVEAPGGQRWGVGVVHLHARAFEVDEAAREREIAVVLDVFAKRRAAGEKHLLVGDFNANSPVQSIDPAKCKEKTREAWDANGGKLPRRVVQTILDVGYLDTLNVADPAAARGWPGSFTTQEPGQRVDYVFASGVGREAIKSAWIERDRLAKYASDHFPVGAEII